MTHKSFALITGASSGIGKSIAYECAKRGMNLILVALPGTGLDTDAVFLRENYNVVVITAEGDLTQHNFLQQLKDIVSDPDITLNLLVNNAGIGYEGKFESLSAEFCNTIIHLNMQAMVLLCKMFIPHLQRSKAGFILNVSSLASFSPMPYKTLYSASKTFVYSFSRALSSELKSNNISVSVLCPGAVPTNARIIQSIKDHGSFGRFTSLSAKQIASEAVAGTLRGKSVIIPGFFNRLCMYIMWILPDTLKLPLLSMQYASVRAGI